jgi:hypothetical protein
MRPFALELAGFSIADCPLTRKRALAMNSIVLLAALSLPIQSAVVPSPAPTELAAAVSPDTSNTMDEALRELLASTTSVMKRNVKADGSASSVPGRSGLVPVDGQVAQANYQQNQPSRNSTNSNPPAQNTQLNGTASPDSTPDTSGQNAGATPTEEGTMRAAANASADLLATALTPRNKNSLAGQAITLADTLAKASAARRLEVASLYWKLAFAVSHYQWSLDESQQLNTLPALAAAGDSPLLAIARAAAEAQVQEAKADAIAAQQELADALGQPMLPLPLTVDQPLVGPYRTEFDTIFANRAAPGRSRVIHRSLPYRREAIDLRTAAVHAAASATALSEAAYGQGKGVMETVLMAHDALSRQRRAFLDVVRTYNADIVEYASYVAGPTTPTSTLVNMLTRKKQNRISLDSETATSQFSDEPTAAPPEQFGVRQASGESDAPTGDWTPGKDAQP